MTSGPCAYDEIARLMVSGMNPERLVSYDTAPHLVELYLSVVEKGKNRNAKY